MVSATLIWLRLFMLMSAEFAAAEQRPEPACAPVQDVRIKEIGELNKMLNAARLLENLAYVVEWTEAARPSKRRVNWTHYLIEHDHEKKQVTISPYLAPMRAVNSYDEAELIEFRSGSAHTNKVLVEVDKVENLREAYPNYFGDVQLFRKQLIDITKGKGASEYTVPPRETVPLPKTENPDLAWIRKRKHICWK